MVAPACSCSLSTVRWWSEFPGSGPDDRSDRRGGQQRRSEQAHDEANSAKAFGTLAHHVVGLLHFELALEVLGHHDRSVQIAAAVEHGLVVLHSGVLGQITADEDVDRFIVECHAASS